MSNFPSKWTSRSITSALLLCATIGCITQRSAHTQSEASEFAAKKPLQLTISCFASPSVIRPGEASTIVATAMSQQNRPLTYSYSASAGAVSGTSATATYSSAGAPTGTVNITCRVSDDQGRTAVATVTVVIRTPPKAMRPPDLGDLVNPTMTGSAVGSPPPPPPPPKSVELPTPTIKTAPGHPGTMIAPVQQPAPKMAAHPSPAQPAQVQIAKSASAPSGEHEEGYTLEAWKKNLKQGTIEYLVPPKMTVQVPAPVTVRIHGFRSATGDQPLLGATGSGPLKVSSSMKVELLAPLDPGEFIITPQSNPAVQSVPIDNSATWSWTVTPAHKAQNETLQIRVSLVYKRPDTSLDYLLEERNYTVNIEVQKLTTTLWQDFQKDPIGFIKYMAPGGAGWGALAALIASLGGLTWWKKKRKKKPVHKP